MRRIFKVKNAIRWAKKIGFTDQMLVQAINEIEDGQRVASLGHKLFKKRVALPGQGKSGSWRIILAFRLVYDGVARWLFLDGYAKSDMSNISPKKLEELGQLAQTYLNLSDIELDLLIKMGKLVEVSLEKENDK